MRFERLVLRRYGAFQERTLDFAPGARLHVVHGPNGAGKSTTLAALRSALFGITAKEGAFRYAPATRRLEVALVRGDGERIEFQRRSSPTQPLWSADDAEPLDAAALVPFLGGLDRATYTRLFGLDQEELRTGGEDLVEQRAELGQALFSAALGAERLAEVRDALGGELAALHTPGSRSKARVAELTREHADLKRRRRDAEFSQGALKKARKEIRELEARADALDGERREHERRAERLTSLAAAARDLARLDDLVEKRSAFGEEPALAEGVASEVRVLFDELKRSDVEATEGRRAELERKQELRDARAARTEAGDGEASGSDPEADRRMLAQLGRALVQAAGRREEAERALERARAAHARAVETHAAAPARAAEEFAADFDALSPFRGGLESLRAVRVPSESAFEQLSVRESSAESAAESAARSLEEAEEKERAALSRTERARAAVGGDVPSAEAVSDARDARDRALESALSAEPSRPERVLEVARLVAEADGLIDERLAAGAGEAELRLAEREEAQARAACWRARAEAAARTDEREVVRADVRTAANSMGLDHASAAGLAAWCARRSALLERARDALARTQEAIDAARDGVESCDVDLGVARRAAERASSALAEWSHERGLDGALGVDALDEILAERAQRATRVRAASEAVALAERRLGAAQERLAAQAEGRAEREARVAALAEEHASGDAELLRARSERADALRALDDERATITARLDDVSAESPGEDGAASLRAELADRGPAELSESAAEAKNAAEHLAEERSDARERLGRARQALEGGGDDAASLEGQLAQVEAELETAVERFSVLHTAEHLLEREIRSYRERSQAPLLARAQELFRTLTLGSFESLQTDEEKGRDVLKARRPSGELVPVGMSGMSEGTAYQLYLALRIATVERSIRGVEPMPFLADDLFTTFDDDRTRAGLEVLAELGRSTQVVVFTHHRPVVESARELGLGDALDVIELESEVERETRQSGASAG